MPPDTPLNTPVSVCPVAAVPEIVAIELVGAWSAAQAVVVGQVKVATPVSSLKAAVETAVPIVDVEGHVLLITAPVSTINVAPVEEITVADAVPRNVDAALVRVIASPG